MTFITFMTILLIVSIALTQSQKNQDLELIKALNKNTQTYEKLIQEMQIIKKILDN